ncbi:hypothetical protein FRC12_017268 [Ceratobasidium sp. 428]|nr:hypothetical protein FRC12_017268 [Ceratobasidium sp. 428]
MYAAHGKHFYVNELSRLHDGALVIPYRWVKRDGKLTADCRRVITVIEGAAPGTVSCCLEWYTIPAVAFSSNYLDLVDHLTEAQRTFTAESKHYGEQMPNPLRELADGNEMATCFIKPWSDDVSGGRTKQYQPHNNIYLAHANIPGKPLNQEFFVRFVSTATHASSTEQFAAENNRNPIRVYNSLTGAYVRLRIYILNLPADNPAQSKEASHIGSRGNLSCRRCKVGGPYQVIETEEGYASFYKPGEPRTVEETTKHIWDQIMKACLGVEVHVKEMQTETGVKDHTAQSLITELIKRGREIQMRIRKSGKLATDKLIMEEQLAWLETQPAPSYLVWRNTNIDGLGIDTFSAKYIVKYPNNLIGRHFKALMQLTAFHVKDIISEDLFTLLKAVGSFGAVLWIPEIDDLELYLADLTILINNVLDAFARMDPGRIIAKVKLHLLTHLVDDIRNHGPAVRYSTELFECYNAVFRMCSVLSNHQAPSRDICGKMKELERFRHIVTGGFWHDDNGKPTCASSHIRHFFRSNPQLQAYLGWAELEPITAGLVKLVPKNVRKEISWEQTRARLCDPVSIGDTDQVWYEGESVTARSGDSCKLGAWVVVETAPRPTIGQITQILVGSTLDQGRVVLDVFNVSSNRHSLLDMPVLVPRSVGVETLMVCSSKDVLFAFNAQHDCHTLSCTASAVETVSQERTNTTIERQSIQHNQTRIYVVNMHALHNAGVLRKVLPRSLVQPIPLQSDEERTRTIAEHANQYHRKEESKRVAAKKKRKDAKEAKAAQEAAEAGGDAQVLRDT